MSQLPRDLGGKQVVAALVRLGFEARRQTGSHFIMRREGWMVVIPMHKPIKPGTLKSVLKQADICVERLLSAL